MLRMNMGTRKRRTVAWMSKGNYYQIQTPRAIFSCAKVVGPKRRGRIMIQFYTSERRERVFNVEHIDIKYIISARRLR